MFSRRASVSAARRMNENQQHTRAEFFWNDFRRIRRQKLDVDFRMSGKMTAMAIAIAIQGKPMNRALSNMGCSLRTLENVPCGGKE